MARIAGIDIPREKRIVISLKQLRNIQSKVIFVLKIL